MAYKISDSQSINVLLSNANWAWPQAVEKIFQPRGINALVANSAADITRLIDIQKIHLAIIDNSMTDLTGMQALKIIRQLNPQLPCILLALKPEKRLLAEALALNAFSVLEKPIDLSLLAGQIDRLFLKHYQSNLFSSPQNKRKLTFKINLTSRNKNKPDNNDNF